MAMPRRLLRYALSAICLALQAQCQCYLEDSDATCAVCWITSGGVRTSRECPEGISVAWEKPLPQQMYAEVSYPVAYSVKIDRLLFDIQFVHKEEKGKVYEAPHSNVHSCIKDKGACTPFVANSPGLSTHTPNTPANFSAHGNFYTQKFETSVELSEEKYTIIAHTRIFVKAKSMQSEGDEKYDIVVGVLREVLPQPSSASADSYISAGVVGAVILLSLGSIVWAARSGKLNLEVVMMAITREEFGYISEIVIQMGDMFAFTMGVKQDVLDDDSMAGSVPMCMVFVCVGWLAALICVQKSSQSLFKLWQSHYRAAKYWDKQAVRKSLKNVVSDATIQTHFQDVPSDASERPTLGAKLAQSYNVMSVFQQYEKSRRQLRGQYVNILTMLLADLPMVGVDVYILAKVDSVEFAVILSLVCSALLLGKKASDLGRFTRHVKELEAAREAVLEVAGELKSGPKSLIQVDAMLSSSERNGDACNKSASEKVCSSYNVNGMDSTEDTSASSRGANSPSPSTSQIENEFSEPDACTYEIHV